MIIVRLALDVRFHVQNAHPTIPPFQLTEIRLALQRHPSLHQVQNQQQSNVLLAKGASHHEACPWLLLLLLNLIEPTPWLLANRTVSPHMAVNRRDRLPDVLHLCTLLSSRVWRRCFVNESHCLIWRKMAWTTKTRSLVKMLLP